MRCVGKYLAGINPPLNCIVLWVPSFSMTGGSCCSGTRRCNVWQEKSGIAARSRQTAHANRLVLARQPRRRLLQPDEIASCCGKLARGLERGRTLVGKEAAPLPPQKKSRAPRAPHSETLPFSSATGAAAIRVAARVRAPPPFRTIAADSRLSKPADVSLDGKHRCTKKPVQKAPPKAQGNAPFWMPDLVYRK